MRPEAEEDRLGLMGGLRSKRLGQMFPGVFLYQAFRGRSAFIRGKTGRFPGCNAGADTVR